MRNSSQAQSTAVKNKQDLPLQPAVPSLFCALFRFLQRMIQHGEATTKRPIVLMNLPYGRTYIHNLLRLQAI